MGFEPMIRVLQTLALPLGHVAILNKEDYKIGIGLCQSNNKKAKLEIWLLRAGNGSRTRKPLPWQGSVLPIELRPQANKIICDFSVLSTLF